jgi:hypothetical protein
MAAIGFAGCAMLSYDCALWAPRTWLNSWPGIGRVAVGMHRQGDDLQPTRDDEAKGGATRRIWRGAAWPSFILTT